MYTEMRSLGDSIALRFIVAFLLLLLLPMSKVLGQRQGAFLTSDTLAIRFQLDSTRIHMDFDGNASRWATFVEHFRRSFAGKDPRGIVMDIYSGASPEGAATHNFWLGQNRGESIRQLVEQRLPGRIGHIQVHNEAARWLGLYQAVAASRESWRDEVLGIIMDAPSIGRRGFDNREWRLRELHGGTVWATLLDRYLPPLRSGATAIVSWKPEQQRDTVFVHDTVFVSPLVTDVVDASTVGRLGQDTTLVAEDTVPCWRPFLALKTNLLFDAALTPNVEIEIPIGWTRWSVMAEWWTPWYRWHGPNKHNRCYEMLVVGAEGRYWLSRRSHDCPRLLRGHFLGLYMAGGKYDIQPGLKKNRGWQGEFLSPGITYGYSAYLGRHWRMEFSASVGYVWGPQRYYHGMFNDSHLIWQHNRHLNYVGPTKLKVSLAYLIGCRIKGKGGRR